MASASAAGHEYSASQTLHCLVDSLASFGVVAVSKRASQSKAGSAKFKLSTRSSFSLPDNKVDDHAILLIESDNIDPNG